MIDWNDDKIVVKAAAPHFQPEIAINDWAWLRQNASSVTALDEAHRKVVERWPDAYAELYGLQWHMWSDRSDDPRRLGGGEFEAAAWIDAANKFTLPSPSMSGDAITEAIQFWGRRHNWSMESVLAELRAMRPNAKPLSTLPSLKEEPTVAVGEFTQEEREKAAEQILRSLGRWEDIESDIPWNEPANPEHSHAIDLQCELNRLRAALGEGKGVGLIAAERLRQMEVEGWTPEHDDKHDGGQLVCAAVTYALENTFNGPAARGKWFNQFWCFEDSWFKPSPDPVRNLVKAGALIAAEIDRLQRIIELRSAPEGESK